MHRKLTAKAALAGIATATLLLGGCRVGPRYVKPVVPTFQAPDAYKDTYKEGDANWQRAAPDDAALRGDWWTLFNDPALSLLEVKAGIQNQNILAYAARLDEARAEIGIQNSARRPMLSTNSGLSGLRESVERPYFNPMNAQNGVADISLPITLSYEVDLFGRLRRAVDQAKEETQASAADLQNVQLTIQAELAMDYFELRSADAQAKLLAETINDYNEALRITTNRFNGGIVNEADVFQAKTQVESAEVQLSDVGVQRANDEHAIAVLIGQPPASFFLAADPLAAQPPAIPASLPSQLLERRPDIAAAERRTAEANERIGIARAAYYPTLNLSLTAGIEAATLPGLVNANNIVYALGPVFGYQFIDGGLRGAVSAQAYASFNEQAADYKQTTLTAFQQVEDNLSALRILSSEAQQQQSAIEAAQGAQRIFNNRYVGGLDTYLQVVTAQQTSLTNERNGIDIMRRRMDASVLLIKALGGGWSTAQLPRYSSVPQP
jgi:NodT family efflux transporter outer membrane factor (OMF) lipoprotein